MSAQAVEKRFKEQLDNLGRNSLHALFPKDIEAYYIGLELVNSRGATVDYFAFPILPDEIRETDTTLTNVRKTMSAVNVMKNSTFNPRQIFIKGDFGRKFKLILGGKEIVFAGFGFSTTGSKFKIVPPGSLETLVPEFSSIAKSGYGCVKLLESIKEKSKQLDSEGKSHSLYLYNPILGNNYQVEFASFTQSQDKSHYNMFPTYTLQLTAVAQLDSILSRARNIKNAVKNLSINGLQKAANLLASDLKKTIRLR